MAVLLDASYLLAFLNESDVHYRAARKLTDEISADKYGIPFTTDHIFDETVSVALRKFGKNRALAFGKHILDSVLMLTSDKHVLAEAWSIFIKTELNLSFTDCINIATLKVTGTEFIATFDKEFKNIQDTKVLD